jgi:hypothetical protein
VERRIWNFIVNVGEKEERRESGKDNPGSSCLAEVGFIYPSQSDYSSSPIRVKEF